MLDYQTAASYLQLLGSVEVEDSPCMRYATLFCESQVFLCNDLRWGTAEVSFVYPACNATYPYCAELPWVSLWLLSIKLDVLVFLEVFSLIVEDGK